MKKINLTVKIYKIKEHEGKKFERIHSRAWVIGHPTYYSIPKYNVKLS
jgi:hypothetical protein